MIIIYCIARMRATSKFEVRRKFAQVIALDEDAPDVDLSMHRKDEATQSTFAMSQLSHNKSKHICFFFIYPCAEGHNCQTK